MSPTVFVFLLSVSRVVLAVLNTPRNVRLTSNNMNLVLRWDPPEGAAAGLHYTAEYMSAITEYREGCVNISTLDCDYSSLNIYEYGRYTGRVRTQLGEKSSPWVESNQITFDKDTIIGSPNVSLFSNGATMEVIIKDPVFTISTLRNVFSVATYNITYWKIDQREKARRLSNIQQNRVVLNELQPWTEYCVQVQVDTNRNPEASEPSGTVCESTTSEAEAPWVAAVVTFVIMTTGVALVVIGVVYRKRISHFLCPKDSLPQHIKEYLLAPPNSPIYLAMRNSHHTEEIYHQVSIITGDKTVEEAFPLEAAESSCCRQPEVTVGHT